jgi:dienelactone hydrolase
MRCSRRKFCVTAAAAVVGSRSARGAGRANSEVPWLDEVQRPPQSPAARQVVLKPPLTEHDQSITSIEAWQSHRAGLRQAWVDFLKPLDLPRKKPVLKVLAEDRTGGCLRQIVQYESEPGEKVEGCLIKPEPCPGKRPGVVVLHPTTPGTFREPAGFEGDRYGAFGLRLAQRGLVTFSPRCFLWPNSKVLLQSESEAERQRPSAEVVRLDRSRAVAELATRHRGAKGMAKMLWDASRALDVLQSLAEVDAGRLGAVGHSLGAKESLYLAAFDDRVRGAMFSEGGIGIRFSNWDAPWYLGADVLRPDFGHDHHELLALIAPRAMLIVGGESGGPNPSGVVDGDRSWPYVDAALPIYRLYGGPARIGLLNHHQGHTVPPEAAERIAQWLQTYCQ